MGFFSTMWARLGLDASGFATGLAQADLVAKRAGARIGSTMKQQFLAYFGTAAIGYAVKNVVEYGGRIADLEKRTFLSKKSLQEFDYIAGQTGTTLEAFVSAEQKLTRAQQDAIGGNKDLTAIFARYGLTVEDLKRMDPHQLFLLLSEAIGRTQLSGQQLDEVLTLMGRSAGDIIPAMKEGFTGLVDEATRFGIVLKDDIIEKLDQAGDRMDQLRMRSRGPAAGLAEMLIGTAESTEGAWRGFNASIRHALGLEFDPGRRSPLRIWRDEVDQFNRDIANQIGSKSLYAQRRKRSAWEIHRTVNDFDMGRPLADEFLTPIRKPILGLSTSMDVLDPLARIGGYMGPDPAVKNILQKQLERLEAIERNTKTGDEEVIV